jgi:hypothetical protein
MAKEVSGDAAKFSTIITEGFVWKPEQIEALWDSILEGILSARL